MGFNNGGEELIDGEELRDSQFHWLLVIMLGHRYNIIMVPRGGLSKRNVFRWTLVIMLPLGWICYPLGGFLLNSLLNSLGNLTGSVLYKWV